ncbi:MAG: hypothetical protein N2C12_09925 [Planctomycetales bacterium]
MIWYEGRRQWWGCALTGFFAAFAAASELPALSLVGLLGLGLLCKWPRQTLLFGLPAVLLVGAAALGTNYAAHRTIWPAYHYRQTGEDWQTNNWYNYTYQVGDRTIPSYWKKDTSSVNVRSTVDQGEPSRGLYILHCLIGHHGIFSLTPIWLFSLAGVLVMLRGPPQSGQDRALQGDGASQESGESLRAAGILVGTLSLTCLLFYLTRGTENRNYGGLTSGLRWMFWLAPLWLLAMIPVADWSAGSRSRRILAMFLLAFSVLSASYPTWNPWSHPWITHWLRHLDWM